MAIGRLSSIFIKLNRITYDLSMARRHLPLRTYARVASVSPVTHACHRRPRRVSLRENLYDDDNTHSTSRILLIIRSPVRRASRLINDRPTRLDASASEKYPWRIINGSGGERRRTRREGKETRGRGSVERRGESGGERERERLRSARSLRAGRVSRELKPSTPNTR